MKQFWNIWGSYAIYYFGKVNLSIIIPALIITYPDLNLYDLGLVSTGFMLAYAIGQFIHGQVSERFHPYTYISTGLIISGIINLVLGFVAGFFFALLVLESFGGFFQAMGWSSTVRANSLIQNDKKKLDESSTILGCSYQIGNSITWIVCAFAVGAFGWQAGFWVSAIILIVEGIILYFTKPYLSYKKESIKKKVKMTLTTPIILSGMSLLFLNMVRYGVMTWLFAYYVFEGNFPIADFGKVSLKIVFIPIAGVIGTLIYNRLPFKKDLISVVFLALMGVTWFLFPYSTGILATILVLLSSAFLYGPHVFLVTNLPCRFKEFVASATGFIDGMGYIGTTIIMLLVPFLVLDTTGGWNNVFLFWAIISFVASGILAINYLKYFRKEICVAN